MKPKPPPAFCPRCERRDWLKGEGKNCPTVFDLGEMDIAYAVAGLVAEKLLETPLDGRGESFAVRDNLGAAIHAYGEVGLTEAIARILNRIDEEDFLD